MLPVRWLLLAGLPTAALGAYFVAVATLPPSWHHLLFWETGIVELSTAAMFGLAGGLALWLGGKQTQMPRRYRAMYLLIGIAAVFAALEELSYGQHLFGWQAHGWFAANNHQQETNLHNLGGDTLRRVLHQLCGNGLLVAGLILPFFAMRRYGEYTPGHWTHYLLPRAELIPIVLLEIGVRVLKRAAGPIVDEFWKFGLDELRECLWAGTLLIYVIVLSRRLGARADRPVILQLPLSLRSVSGKSTGGSVQSRRAA